MQRFPDLILPLGSRAARVARLRSGRGSSASLKKALEAAGMDLRGLPRGRNWGERVAAQRKRKGLSQGNCGPVGLRSPGRLSSRWKSAPRSV
jgi:hypothetical protein